MKQVFNWCSRSKEKCCQPAQLVPNHTSAKEKKKKATKYIVRLW